MIMLRCVRWQSHVPRMDKNRMPKRALFGRLRKMRPFHSVKLWWRDQILFGKLWSKHASYNFSFLTHLSSSFYLTLATGSSASLSKTGSMVSLVTSCEQTSTSRLTQTAWSSGEGTCSCYPEPWLKLWGGLQPKKIEEREDLWGSKMMTQVLLIYTV